LQKHGRDSEETLAYRLALSVLLERLGDERTAQGHYGDAKAFYENSASLDTETTSIDEGSLRENLSSLSVSGQYATTFKHLITLWSKTGRDEIWKTCWEFYGKLRDMLKGGVLPPNGMSLLEFSMIYIGGGLQSYAEGLYTRAEHEGAISAMRDAVEVLDQLSTLESAVDSRINAFCNLSSAIVRVGEWTSDATSLQLAIRSADQGLRLEKEPAAASPFLRAVLLHNRGDAGRQLGVILHDRRLLERARDDIKEAGDLFSSMQKDAEVAENAELLSKTTSAILRL
jgi:tetratricopeptide (TPR) repeat protein